MFDAQPDPYDLRLGDSRAVLRELAQASIDSVVTDPPYALLSIQKRFAKVGRTASTRSRSGPHQRTARGFMGQSWDTGEVAFDPEFWAEVLRVLKPGAHLVAFGGTRTYHRLVCAIEDAGFEIRDQIGWAFGSGFPKSHNQHGDWEGWGTALKPAWEPICLARKPLIGTVAANLAEHGTGALNIGGCRVGTVGPRPARDARLTRNESPNGIYGDGLNGSRACGDTDVGRWPANLCHDGSDEVLAAFPDKAGASAPVKGTEPSSKTNGIYGGGWHRDVPGAFHGDSGSAARFFYCAKASRADRNEGCDHLAEMALNWSAGEQNPGSFQSEGTHKAARNNHPTVKPTDLMRWLVRLVTPPGGLVLDPFMGSGSTGKACMLEGFGFVGVERSPDYMEIAKARVAFGRCRALEIAAERDRIPDQLDMFQELA